MADVRTIMTGDLAGKREDGSIEWYAVPDKSVSVGGRSFHGTFYSAMCIGLLEGIPGLSAQMCHHCRDIPQIPSFRMRLARMRKKQQQDGDDIASSNTRNDYLPRPDLLLKIKHKTEQMKMFRQLAWLNSMVIARLQNRVRSLKAKVDEFVGEGELRGVCARLVRAYTDGEFADRGVLFDYITSSLKNVFSSSSNGHRFPTTVQHLYEIIYTLGGPRIQTFISLNMEGPNARTVARWRSRTLTHYTQQLDADLFKQLGTIYCNIKSQLHIDHSVPVLCAEDETPIIKEVRWDAANDSLVGFCGLAKDHKCMSCDSVVVGDTDDSYERIAEAFRTMVVGTHARVLILNPLDPRLPRLVILATPTCLR